MALFIITVLAGLVAIYDGIIRVRQRRSYWPLAIVELLLAVAMLVSLAPFAHGIHQLAPSFLLFVEFMLLFLKSTVRRRVVTAIGFVLTLAVVLVVLEFVALPPGF